MTANSYDVIVLGSGAAGLTAALAAGLQGATVGLFEKAHVLGGTTALSGGGCWVPNTSQMHAAGYDDSRDEALTYLASLGSGTIAPDFAEVFVDEGPAAFDWLCDKTSTTFNVVPGYPDYHPENPGGKTGGGRTLEPELFSFKKLGSYADLVARSKRSVHLRLIDTTLGGGTGFLEPEVSAQREAEDLRGCGGGLVGPLLAACLDLGIEPVINAAGQELLMTDGRVTGVRITIDGVSHDITARRGVVIATGGFEFSPALVEGFLRGPMTTPAGIPSNTGDGLTMSMRAGASLANMPHAWWVPVAEIPGDEIYGHQRGHLILRERTLPRSIFVNSKGVRFTNEAASYNALGSAFHEFDMASFNYANLPCWLIFDQGFVDRYGFIGSKAGEPVHSWVTSASTLAELSTLIDVPAEALTQTVSRWNTMVSKGRDSDYGRADSAYDLWAGDATKRGSRDATLGPLDQGPFYAIEIKSGTLGTCGGPRIDVDGRVLDHAGHSIPGLFAAGNAAAAPTGMAYAGAGGTLGPIITFAKRTGEAVARTS